jgi:outer membrane immunogenic protein
MKKLIINSLIAFSLIASKAAFATPLAKSNFEGFYAGLGTGYSWGEDKGTEYKSDNFDGGIQRTSPRGSLASVFAGVNTVTKDNILFGAEADFDRRDYSKGGYQDVNGVAFAIYPVETKIKNGQSVRGKIGYVFNNDKTLSYLTIGYATINIKRTYGDMTEFAGNGPFMNKTVRQNGGTFGFGLEHFITDKVSLRSEYRYTRYLAGNHIDTSAIYSPITTESQRFTDQTIRVGVSYHF